jgi:hypothetical protein
MDQYENQQAHMSFIFIEEPEVHLHAQVQQTFITNIWNVLKENAKDAGEESFDTATLRYDALFPHIRCCGIS